MKLVKHVKTAFLASSIALSNLAFADGPPPAVMDKVTETGAMLVTVITAVIVGFVGFWGLKKLGAKMGFL